MPLPSGRERQSVPAALAAELSARPGWGAPPTLYLMEVVDGRCQLDPLPVPARAWRGRPLHHVIVTAAASIRRAHAGPADPVFIGTAVRFDDWDLPWPLLPGRALPLGPRRLCRRHHSPPPRPHPDPARPRRRPRRVLMAGTPVPPQPGPPHRHLPSGGAPAHGIPRAWAAICYFTRAVLEPGEPGRPEPEAGNG